MSGWLAIAGLGPGAAELVTPEVTDALAQATDLIGYAPYVARVPERARPDPPRLRQSRGAGPRQLLPCGLRPRANASSWSPPAIPACSRWRRPCSRRSMPAIAAWRDLDIRVLPGISAMFAAAARIGAPLGHDFCAINLSDNLKPWESGRTPAAAGGASRFCHRALQSAFEGAALAARPRVRVVA